MKMKKITWTMLTILAIGWISFLYGNDDNKPGWKWKPDDLLIADRVGEYRLSPDGKKLAWTIEKWNLKEHKKYNILYLTHLERKKDLKQEKIQLSRGEDTFSSIQWVPGEKNNRISFKTERKFKEKEKETKPGNIWIMNLDGGDPYPVTNLETEVKQYEWLAKDNLLFIAGEATSLCEKEKKKKKDTSEMVEDEEHREITRLFTYDLKTKKTKRLTNNDKPLESFTLSHNKEWVIYEISMSLLFEQNQEIRPKYYLMNLKSAETREIFSDPTLKPKGTYKWAVEDEGFYAYIQYTTHPKYDMASVTQIYRYALDTGRYGEVALDWDRYAESITAAPGGFIAALPDGVYFKYARYYKKGETWKKTWLEEGIQKNIRSLQLAEDGKTMIYEYSTASLPRRYYLAELNGGRLIEKQEVMDLQSPLFERPLAKTKIIRWQGAKEETVEGILYYPYRYEAGKQYPLILMIHGGPYDADEDIFSDGWSRPAHLLAERGAFILKVNYHGSSNYGLQFGESIAGHYYEYEIPDIEKGADELIKQGMVDKDKLGIIGWSNGGILGIGLIVNNKYTYRAASLGAADVNWTSDYGNCEFGVSFDNYYLGGPPWEKQEDYIKKSPLFQLDKVTTPTLIFHGDKDRAVPYHQGWEFYRALQTIGKAPVRFISFPGEKHVPKKLAHLRRKLSEEIQWFEKYLFERYQEKNDSLEKGSPLDLLAAGLEIAKVDGRYGTAKKDLLIPEVVEYKNKHIGRFEVTRAQWAAFDKNYSFEKETGNYPVTGITFEQAKQYVQWLSEQTGESFRLPGKDEIEILYSQRSGNTFDYWAGYTLNPDDYKNLLKELEKYKDKPILLKPVGSFKAETDEDEDNGVGACSMVFDLGGNAAEWAVVEGDKGKACGGSAERPVDLKSDVQPQSIYTGFRVIKSPPAPPQKPSLPGGVHE